MVHMVYEKKMNSTEEFRANDSEHLPMAVNAFFYVKKIDVEYREMLC
jgi:hypothetical protein